MESILIVGNGGREYSIGLALVNDPRVKKLYFTPGNGASSVLGENLLGKTPQDILDSIHKYHISLVIIGPEAPLSDGLADFLRGHGVRVFGPSAQAALLESSKAFMKDLVSKAHIPTARYVQSSDIKKLYAFIDTLHTPIVVKADGLCAGKGVIIATSKDEAKQAAQEMLSGNSFGEAGKCVVVEEFLDGYELSVFALCDGEDFIMLPACQDHKRLLSCDKGPNTGGMGAYTPTPLCDDVLMEKIKQTIIAPALKAMKECGRAFEGVLFGGIMVCKDSESGVLTPYLLEFNVRFGDPECEVLLPLLQTPLLDIIHCILQRRVRDLTCIFKPQYAVGVVAASRDYPTAQAPSVPISIQAFDKNLGHIVYAGVSRDSQNSQLLASGGRVLLSVGIADTLRKARDNAYEIMRHVHFEGMQFRDDIAYRAL